MSLLCSCYNCKESTPFDQPCQACGFENPVFPDTIESAAQKFLNKHASPEPLAPPAAKPIPPAATIPAPPVPPAPIIAPVPLPNSKRPAPVLGTPLIVFIHPVLGLSAGALLAYALSADDFVERLIYYFVSGIVLLIDALMLVVEADRLAEACKKSWFWRILNALATLPPALVLISIGNEELTAGFALLRGNWFAILWSLKYFSAGGILTLLGLWYAVYACELIANKVLIGSSRGKKS